MRAVLKLFARIRKGHQPVRVQALRTQLAVKSFDEAIVGRLARPREVRCDLVHIGPQIEVAGDIFASIARREEVLSIGNGHPRSPK